MNKKVTIYLQDKKTWVSLPVISIRLSYLKKALIIFLQIALLVQSLPSIALASEATPSASVTSVPEHSEIEIPQEKEASSQQATSQASTVVQSPVNDLSGLLPIEVTKPEQSASSAHKRTRPALRKLAKKIFRANEKIIAYIDDARGEIYTVTLKSKSGEELPVEVYEVSEGSTKSLTILPPAGFVPGSYTLEVEDSAGEKSNQDFVWGVLAINTDKSVYLPQENASLAIAVLDDEGKMVCNADVSLQITDPEGTITDLTTEDEQIRVNPECFVHGYTVDPDYETEYEVNEEGMYRMVLTAITDQGTYSITDSFEVREEVDFDVRRTSATRIYPLEKYPVVMEIMADRDFQGIVTESVPEDFEITPLEGVKPYEKVKTVQEFRKSDEDILESRIDIGMPFESDRPLTAGFGGRHEDEMIQSKYEQYGVVGHDGADFDMPVGTPVLAADSGEIILAEENHDYGTTIIIQHAWGKSYYGHLGKLLVQEGNKVRKGRKIALSGNSGLSTDPHLHFGIKPNNYDSNNGFYGKVDPLPYLGLAPQGELLSHTADEKKTKLIAWSLDVKKGETVKLGYMFDAPDVSPQFYTTGPLKFINTKGDIEFKETRLWQIAVDDVESRYATSHITGSFTNPNNALGATDGVWAGTTNANTSYTSRWAMDDPSSVVTGTQTINVGARKGTNSGNPSIAVNLYENGSLVQAIAATTSITSSTGQTVSGTFNASAITNMNNVEIEVVATGVGGNGSTRNTAQVDYIEWVVTYTPPITTTVATTGSQTASATVGTNNFYAGGAFTMVTSSSSVTVSSITVSDTGTINASSHISNVDIYYETAGTCTYNGTETLFGTAASVTSEQATVTGSMSVGTSQVCVYVVLDVSASATPGQTIELQITNPSTQVSVSSGTVSPATAIATSGTTTLAAAGPSLDQLMRHGKWFNSSGVRQPFTF